MDKVIGIGNALVDVMIMLTDELMLEKFKFQKGSMQLVDIKLASEIDNATLKYKKSLSSGGSAANTIHGLAKLGIITGFIGKVGADETGEFFREDMQINNIEPHLLIGENPSGRAMALITPDSERTFGTYLGAAIELIPTDLINDHFKGYKYLHIEGYLVQNNALLIRAAELAKENALRISLDMASFNVVEANLEFLREYVRDHVDILFANEEEAHAFTGKNPEDALNEIAAMCDIAVVKTGPRGSLIKRGDKVYRVNPLEAKKIDTTGAGDLYASGFIYGLIKNYDLQKCGEIGTLLASNVIEVIGSKMPEEKWDYIKSQL